MGNTVRRAEKSPEARLRAELDAALSKRQAAEAAAQAQFHAITAPAWDAYLAALEAAREAHATDRDAAWGAYHAAAAGEA